MKKLLVDLLTKYRSPILIGVGLPAGMVFDAVSRVRDFIHERFHSAPEEHDERVRDIQAQVRRWGTLPDGERKPMCTDRKTWKNLSTRFEPKHRWHRVRMSGLRDVLSVDLGRRTVRVEPFVTVGQITRYLVARGHMLEVTLEIEEATVGGLAMAAGMTTHSHKSGMLHETVVAYDVVLADGTLVRASETENPELFRALPCSHGTLGLLVALELRIMPVKPYVHLSYTPVRGKDAYCRRLKEVSTAEDAPDFVEATVYARDEAVLMTGRFADVTTAGERARTNRIGRWWKPWFYKHVEQYLEAPGEEYVPLEDYLSRHNRSIFWVAPHMIPQGNHPVFRWLAGWMMPPRIAFLKFSTTPAVRRMTFTLQVFQDIVLPMSAMSRAIDRTDELFGMYPILLYPSRIYDHGALGGQLPAPRPEDRVPGKGYGMYFDLGVYGVPLPIRKGERFKTVHAMRAMEELTREVGGFPFLYADTFMTREEFRRTFDLRLYDEMRRRYGAEQAFPDLYDKIKPEVDVFGVLEEEKGWTDAGPSLVEGGSGDGRRRDQSQPRSRAMP